jgi:hypothetical protein
VAIPFEIALFTTQALSLVPDLLAASEKSFTFQLVDLFQETLQQFPGLWPRAFFQTL